MHLLVPVTVASLCKSLKADGAGVRALASMGSHVVEDITKFREFLFTGEALEDLILAPCRRVDRLGPLVSFLFYYLLARGLLARRDSRLPLWLSRYRDAYDLIRSCSTILYECSLYGLADSRVISIG